MYYHRLVDSVAETGWLIVDTYLKYARTLIVINAIIEVINESLRSRVGVGYLSRNSSGVYPVFCLKKLVKWAASVKCRS